MSVPAPSMSVITRAAVGPRALLAAVMAVALLVPVQLSAEAQQLDVVIDDLSTSAMLEPVGMTATHSPATGDVGLSRAAHRGAPWLGMDVGADLATDVDRTGSMAVGDLDGDGDLDVVAGVSQGVNRVYVNDGSGTFGVGSDLSPDIHTTSSVLLADVDGDGDLDALVGNHGRNRLYANEGNGVFGSGSDLSVESDSTTSLAVGDLDGDGDLDLVVGNEGPAGQVNRVHLNDGSGVFGAATDLSADAYRTVSVVVGDVDGDGDLDVVTGNTNRVNRVHFNDGSGAFGGGSDLSPDVDMTRSVVLADIDGDGDLDAVAANNGNDRVYRNDGTGAFDNGTDLSTDTHSTLSVTLGDLDGDGDLDVVTGTLGDTSRVYRNDGRGVFESGSDMSSDIHTTYDMVLGDLDGDGDLDALAGNRDAVDRVYLNNGVGAPFSTTIGTDLSADSLFTYAMATGDIDGDGDLDVVAGNIANRNRVYTNDGTGDFGAGANLSSHGASTLAIALGDLDEDGDLDVVTGNYSDENRIYFNDGSGNFGAGMDLSAEVNDTNAVALGDLDGDGDLDVVTGNDSGENRIYFNDGSGNFGAGADLSAEVDDTNALALGDVDGDGDLDVVASHFSGTNRVYLNDGDGTFAPGTDMSPDTISTYDVTLGDVDGDGDLDAVVGTHRRVNRLYRNDGNGVFDAGTDLSSDADYTYSVALGDVDGDGDLDVVVGNSGTGEANVVYSNLGAGVFDAGEALTSDKAATTTVVLADVDSDGDLDAVTANTGEPSRVYLNARTPAPPGQWTPADLPAGADFTTSVVVGDVDGDGDLDTIAGNTGGLGETNRLYRNDGAGGFGTESDLSTDSRQTWSVALGDLDGDGDLDVVDGNVEGTNRVYRNDGSGAFDPGADLSPDSHNTYSVALGDLDGDGDLDAVAGNFSHTNRLYLNDGDGTFGAGSDLSADSNATWSVALGDLDGDGDLDVVAANRGDRNRVYLNDGLGSFVGSDLATIVDDTWSVELGDVDGDGDLDAVTGTAGGVNRIHLNDGLGVFGAPTELAPDIDDTVSLALGDVNGDGHLDVVTGNADGADRLYPNDGAGGFGAGSEMGPDTDRTNSIALGDVDRDGDLDAIAGGERRRVYEQQRPWVTHAGTVSSLDVNPFPGDVGGVTLTPLAAVPVHTAITWSVSNDGARWWRVVPGQHVVFPTSGGQLRWRADLTSLSPMATPVIDAVTLDVTTAIDAGDAPASYPTLLADDGARHDLGSGLALGSLVDADIDGVPDPDALGDDASGDDEDGIVFDELRAGQTATLQVTATAGALLDGWMDFNADGDWTDPGEQVFTDRAVVAGVNLLSVAVPADAALSTRTFARFRVSTTGGLAPTGHADDGEVEDHAIVVTAVPTVDAGGPYVTSVGVPVALSAVGDDPDGGAVVFAWDLDDDGTFESVGNPVDFPAADPGVFDVTVRVTDDEGDLATAIATVEVTAPYRPPSPTPEPTEGVVEPAEPTTADDVIQAAIDLSALRFDGTDGYAGTGRDARHVVLARMDVFADALAGSVLTGHAPLLFTAGDELDDRTANEIGRVLPDGGTVYMLGGPAALSPAIEASLAEAGHRPLRLSGASRVETALAIADEAIDGTQTEVAIARADVWADAITAGGWAADTATPILITQTDLLHPAVASWLEVHEDLDVVALGGAAALSDEVVDSADATRVAGVNRYATAVTLADQIWPAPAGFLIANGTADDAWAFTLAGAGLAADLDQPTLLVDVDRLPEETGERVCAADELPELTVIGPHRLIDQTVRDLLARPC